MLSKKIKAIILKNIFSRINKRYINAIILFGSRARGDSDKNSDYDVNVFVKRKARKNKEKILVSGPEIFIEIIDKEKFHFYFEKAHPHLYCSFRDGVPLYQKNNWFDKMKPIILRLRPSKDMIMHYLKSSFDNFLIIKIHKDLLYSNLEDGKVAANQLGFAILMHHQIYPISPHTLKQELKKLNKKYNKN